MGSGVSALWELRGCTLRISTTRDFEFKLGVLSYSRFGGAGFGLCEHWLGQRGGEEPRTGADFLQQSSHCEVRLDTAPTQ